VPRGFILTQLGETVLRHAQTMRDEMLVVERTISGQDQRLAGSVRVTTIDVLAFYVMIPVIKDLQLLHPELVVELVPETRSLSLSKREADIALRAGPFAGNALVTRKLGVIEHRLFAATALQVARPHIDDWSADSPVITVLDDHEHLPQVQWFHQMFDKPNYVLRTNDRVLQGHAASQGLGLACLPYILGQHMTALTEIAVNDAPQSVVIHLGVHHDMRKMPRVRAVIDAIVNQCEQLSQTMSVLE